jgi:threonine dehydratase
LYDEDPQILLKPEMLQPIGSYKIRGVYNWVKKLSPEQRAKGISTASSGNMAQAVAYTAKQFNIPSRTIVFETKPQTKIDSILKYARAGQSTPRRKPINTKTSHKNRGGGGRYPFRELSKPCFI